MQDTDTSTFVPPAAKPAVIRQAKTPLDEMAESYMRRTFGSPWTWSAVLDKLLMHPYDAELLKHAKQCSLSHCVDSPLCSAQIRDLLSKWDTMSTAEQLAAVHQVLDVT